MTSAPSFRLLPVEATEAMLIAMRVPHYIGNVMTMDQATQITNAAAYRAAVSAAPVMGEATEWKPIETAPKAANVRVLVGGRTRTGVELTDVATWSATYQRWADAVQGVALGFIPTHWQPITPLPDPPAINSALAIAAGQLGGKET